MYVKAGLENSKAALLVLIGADAEGRKQVLAVESGERESTESWTAVLRDLKAARAPRAEAHDRRRPSRDLGRAGDDLPDERGAAVLESQAAERARHGAAQAAGRSHRAAPADRERRDSAPGDEAARRVCAHVPPRVFPKAVACLERDWERLVAYYAFPQEHWKHLRTTNVIESPFAAVRLRTSAAKRFKKVENATALIWKTLLVVEQHFRKLNAPHLCTAVYDGAVFHDGICTITPTRKLRAA